MSENDIEPKEEQLVDLSGETQGVLFAAIEKVRGYIIAMSGDPHNDTQLYYKTAALEALDALERGNGQVEVGPAPVGEQGDGAEGDKPASGSGDNVVGEGQGQDQTGVQSE